MTRKSRFAGVYPSGKSHWMYRISLPRDPVTGKRGQDVRGGYATDEDAFIARRARKIELGLGSDAPDDRITVGAWVSQWLESHALHVSENTIYNYRGRTRHMAPIAGVQLRELTVPRVQRWVDGVARSVSAASARDARQLLVQALNEAIRQRLIPTNVAHLSRAPRHVTAKRAILTNRDDDRQIDRFVAAAESDPFGAGWMLMLLCQLRPGEVAGLHWRDVNVDRPSITITATRTRNEQGRWIVGDRPKTASSERTITLPTVCVRLLKEHRRRQTEFRLKAPPGWWRDHDLVFPNARGEVLSNDTIDYRLARLCETAGVPRLTPHALRTTGATWARTLGEDAEVVQRRLGHANVATTLGTYSLERPDESRDTSERLERSIRKPG